MLFSYCHCLAAITSKCDFQCCKGIMNICTKVQLSLMSKAMRAQIKKITSNQNTIVDHGWWCNSLWHAPINSSSFTQNTVRQYTERVIYLNNTLFNIILVQEVFSGITWLMEFEWSWLLLCIKCSLPPSGCVSRSHTTQRNPMRRTGSHSATSSWKI